jgi:two-component system, OmpR family, KDP operon response regulator KdpE
MVRPIYGCAVTRRRNTPEVPPATTTIGRYTIDLAAHAAHRTDDPRQSVHLTRTEWQLLEVLARNPGKLLGQRQLLREVWGPTYLDQTQYLRQYMAQLRRKLEDDPARPRHLITEPGMGYRFQP